MFECRSACYRGNDKSVERLVAEVLSVGLMVFVQLDHALERVLAVAQTHHRAQLVHHLPDGLVALVAELALHLQGRERLLGGGHQVNRREPVHQRQLAAVHHRARGQCGLVVALFAAPALVIAVPVVLFATALGAHNAFFLANLAKVSLTGGLVWESLGKL